MSQPGPNITRHRRSRSPPARSQLAVQHKETGPEDHAHRRRDTQNKHQRDWSQPHRGGPSKRISPGQRQCPTLGLSFASRDQGFESPYSTGQRNNSNTPAESTAAKYSNRGRVRCRTRVRVGLFPCGWRPTDPGSAASSGPLNRKNDIVASCAACLAVSGQRGDSAVSRLAHAAHAEGQRMALIFIAHGGEFS